MTEPSGPGWMDDAAQERVRAVLRAHADHDEVAMPTDVATRLHARLAIETAAPAEVDPAPVTQLPVGAKRRVQPQTWYAAAAGFVLLAGGTTFVALTHHSSNRPASESATSSLNGAPAPNLDKAKTLPDERITHSGAALADAAALDAHVRNLVSGADTGAVAGAAGTADAPAAGTAPQAAAASGSDLLSTVAGGLTTCVASLYDSKVPIAVDEVTYQGQDSLLVLFPGASAKEVAVFVVGPACGGPPPDGLRSYSTVSEG